MRTSAASGLCRSRSAKRRERGSGSIDPDWVAGKDEFLQRIMHYVYRGDTQLHVAAASYDVTTIRKLLKAGASVAATNRRGAQALHYACDGSPDFAHWNPAKQGETVALLIGAGADVEARDKSGVAPIHRAVRCRCTAAVATLLAAGADPRLPNRSGSRPLDLARRDTGRGAVSAACKREQKRIEDMLLARIGEPGTKDGSRT